VEPVERDKFIDRRMNGKSRACQALIMARVPVTVGNRCRDAGERTGRAAPESKRILAGTG
jgi:hypothetical protein